MNDLIYKIKNRLFNVSNEANKLKRPTYDDLIKYKNFEKNNNNKFALSFGVGRSGQNWFSKIFNSHPNWIGTCERFADYEAFYRYVSYYNLPIHKDGFFELIKLASNRDMAKYQNSFISSPYLSFGVEELTTNLKPDYIFFNIRNPVKTVESLYKKGWYLNFDNLIKFRTPHIDISESQYRSFSRIIPSNSFLDEWLSLTRIGKITWFWCTANLSILNDFNKIKNVDKFLVKLEEIDQNFLFYEKLSEKFNFEKKMTKSQFYDVVNKAPNKGRGDKYLFKSWSNLEKREFENLINAIFPNYDEITSNF